MGQPFEGIRILDITHVLAGPFATYQLALLGADVIKIEHPTDPDHARRNGVDLDLNANGMGTSFMTQGGNKRSLSVDLKTAAGQAILKNLAKTADVLVENYRPGALDALGLGYADLKEINPRLIYCSMSAFGSTGPRSTQTGYDHIIQASSGLMAATGTPEVNPVRFGPSAVDYATGTMGAFAVSSALFQRAATGVGQRIDLSMLDTAMMLLGSMITGYFRDGTEPRPMGNMYALATMGAYPTRDGLIMIGAGNLREQARLWQALGHPEMIMDTNEPSRHDKQAEMRLLTELLSERTADEWEVFFQERHVPAARIRTMAQALDDPHTKARGVVHEHREVPGVPGTVTVPKAAFSFEHGGPQVKSPPVPCGHDNAAILAELGYTTQQISQFERDDVI
jgi:crotonobetainyl-CoA:carnitine CoA-transferase CaiB-like acyl-CoA transferase